MANLHVQHHIICIHLHYHVLTLGSVLSVSFSGAAEVVNGKSRLAICTTRLGSRRVAATSVHLLGSTVKTKGRFSSGHGSPRADMVFVLEKD